ncbi:MAG: hypothetical protein H8E44_28485 [Planctomycetes bacterium]|nr:hypothetical protein [Planctomycetota bacterium]
MFKDVYNNVTIVQVHANAAATADANSTAIDTWDYPGGVVTFIAVLGATGDTLDANNYIELKVEDSPDNSTFTDVVDAELSNSVTSTTAETGCYALVNAGTEDSLTYATQYIGDKRYVRTNIDVVGTHTNGTAIGIVAVVSGKQYASGA